jgi:hypothetical protein
MKKWFLNVLEKIIDFLYIQYTKCLPKNKINLPYLPLSPTDKAEKVEYYLNTLEWALNNRDEIKNIAITGPYGSGKSSVLRTFQKKHKYNNDYNFLNISLATFKEEIEDETPKEKDNILRLIELSILQQLFYHEKDNKIPDSRFKKIKSHKNKHLWFITVGTIVFLISFLYLVFPNFLAKFSITELTSKTKSVLHYTSVIFVLIGITFLIFKSIRMLKGITIKKLGISNATIEIDNEISKSILNNHIDEILYFFEVTDYNIVIIEDLDRFKQTDVFTKLREINLLINNSKKIEKDVVFIYAIRDDMFQDKDRTKFFDFMMPIIPVINSSNSNEKLLKIVKDNNYDISENLIEDISLFIDDMRLLYNIMNEYHIYHKKLDNSLNQNNLLAMIVYKNIYPNDFTKLSQNQGKLYEIIISKHKYINELVAELECKIISLKGQVETAEQANIKDIKELRMVYLYKIIEKINQVNTNKPFFQFWLNNKIVSMSQAVEDDYFEIILNNNRLEYYYNNLSYRSHYNLNFSSIEDEVNSKLSYKEREKIILNGNQIEDLKNEIKKLEDKKNETKKYKLKNLLSENKIKINSDNKNQEELINVLLRNGYIDENYLDYISIFYEGSLSKNDYKFLISVKTQNENDFDFPLYQKENLIKRISEFEFEKKYILNYDLIDFLINSSKYSTKQKKVFSQLSNESEISIRFIDEFIDYESNIEIFINILCKNWINIWNYISTKSNFTEDKIQKYFKLIIEHADVRDIKKIFNDSKGSISDNKNFLVLIDDHNKLEQIINELGIKFNVLNESSPKELLDYIYENNFYALSVYNIKFILRCKNKLNVNDFNNKNYTLIKKSRLENLIRYVDENIEKYIENVYLKIESNTKETEEFYIEILNNKNISIENKKKIIEKVETLIKDVNKIDDKDTIRQLLVESKILATWKNLIDVYIQNENVFMPELTTFLNVPTNSNKLSEINIKQDYPDEENTKTFLSDLLLNDDIENNIYSKILSSIPFSYNLIGFENISFEKVKSLIENNLITTDNTNFKLLKSNFEGLHISLIENNPDRFIKELDSFELENEDLLSLLESTKISIQIKEKIINNYNTSTFTVDSDLLTQIGKLLIKNNNLVIDEKIIIAIGKDSKLSISNKIQLFNKWNRIYKNTDINNFLISLGSSYSAITELGKRPLLDDTEFNRELANILKNKRYISKFAFENKKSGKKGIRISTFKIK